MTDPTDTDCLLILGPTCAWKSSTAIQVAAQLDAEIVGCDSMQIYRGMSVGTAAPSPEDMALIPHHLVGILPIDQPYDANRYVADSQALIRTLKKRNKRPLICGGTGLYAKALVYDFRLLPADKTLNRELLRKTDTAVGKKQLVEELRQPSPEKSIPQQVILNPRRLARAVEVLRLTGKTPWEHAADRKQPRQGFHQVIILPDMSILRSRIETRTRAMLQAGWVQETRRLMEQGLFRTPTARQALGYRQVARFIEGAIPSLDLLQDCLVQETVKYARRQRTWFKNQHPGASLIVVSRQPGEEELAKAVIQCVDKAESHGNEPRIELVLDR